MNPAGVPIKRPLNILVLITDIESNGKSNLFPRKDNSRIRLSVTTISRFVAAQRRTLIAAKRERRSNAGKELIAMPATGAPKAKT